MTRAEHMDLISDLRKHPETSSKACELLSGMLILGGHLETPAEIRKWIEGFN